VSDLARRFLCPCLKSFENTSFLRD
jgi:hypothetical protein